MRASDPRFLDYQLLQLELAAVLNVECHFNYARLPLDPLLWRYGSGDRKPGREEAADALRAAMRQLISEGLDDVPHAK